MEYSGATFALLTQHGKEQVIGPLFTQGWNAGVQLVTGFDTDALGSFTREVPRDGSQLEAARKKARIGMERSGLSFGLGSEGAFGPSRRGRHATNIELVVLVDGARGIEIVGQAQTPGQYEFLHVSTREQLDNVAVYLGFPDHGLVMRPDNGDDPRYRKDFPSEEALFQAFDEIKALSSTSVVFVENDCRAHLNPTRMKTIAAATRDLIRRMASPCSNCGSPGFGFVAKVPGLPCRACASPTRAPRAEQFECVSCRHQDVRDLPVPHADPMGCENCNP